MKKLFVALAMLIAINANAQWVQMSNGITGYGIINDLAYSGNNILASTPQGLFTSTNFGTNWIHSTFTNYPIWALATNGNYVYASVAPALDSGILYISTNNGVNWTQSSMNNRSVYKIVIKENNMFAGTFLYGVYLSTNNGYNWSMIGLNNKTVPCLAVNGNTIYAGTDTYGIYYSTNNGTNCIQTSLNNKSINTIAVSGNTIFAGTSTNGVYISTDNGLSWIQSTLNNQSVFEFVIYNENIIAGVSNSGIGGVYISINNGATWTPINEGFSPSTGVISLIIINNYIYAGTTHYVWRRPLSQVISIQNISMEIPAKYSLGQNYPNPFNPMTNVKFSIVNSGDVKIVVYDVMGKEVKTLVNERLNAGTYEVRFDALHGGSSRSLTSGVYFYRMVTEGYSETKKMLLLK